MNVFSVNPALGRGIKEQRLAYNLSVSPQQKERDIKRDREGPGETERERERDRDGERE